ncbi:hypothetical protein ACS0TY_023828 [Phlomoides rotata]
MARSVVCIIKIYSPLVRVLRLVDGERKPTMGYIYEVMDRAKEIIMKVFDNKENEYKDAFEIIDMRWSFQLHRSLHATGFFLNPEFFYKNGGDDVGSGVSKGFYDDMESLVPNPTFVEVHAKKRNMLEQQHMNDLVFVKYNRVLKCRYDARVHIDPISLKDIDESNEWVVSRMEDEKDELVFKMKI